MKKIILVFLIVLISINYASSQNIDSLLQLVNSAPKAEKADIYLELSKTYLYRDLDTAENYCQQALKWAEKTGDKEKQIDILIFYSKIPLRQANYKKSLELLQKAFSIANEINNDSLKALCYHKMGNVYYFKGLPDSAASYYIKSLKIRKQINDLQGIAAMNNNLGVIYKTLKNYPLAITYFKNAEKYYLQINDLDGQASALNNIGVIYWVTQKYDSAEIYYKKSLDLAQKLGDKVLIENRYNNLGVLYRDKGEYEKALEYFRKALKLVEELQLIKDKINLYNNIGRNFVYLKQFDSAYYYLSEAQKMAKKYDDLYKLQDNYLFFSKYFAATKQYDSAYNYAVLWNILTDTLYKRDIARQISELKTQYEVENMQHKIELQNLNLQKTKAISRILIVSTSIFLIMAIALFFMFREKRKANIILMQQKQEILQQKEEIQTQAEQLQMAYENISEQKEQIENQANIIKQINEKLTDSIKSAQKIQEAMLPFEENFSKFFETFIIYRPKDIVSGDFYWFSREITVDNHKYLFAAVVDCTGHGVPGALMSMVGIRMLGEFINEQKITSPAKVLEEMDKLTISALKQEVSDDRNGMDICLVRFERKENNLEVVFAGAKRDLYYYDTQKNDIIIIKGVRRSIGGGIKKYERQFTDNQFITDYQTIFYLTSDGFIDQNNKNRRKFGSPRLIKLLKEIGNKPLNEQKTILENALDDWMQDTSQRDDITVVGLKVKKLKS